MGAQPGAVNKAKIYNYYLRLGGLVLGAALFLVLVHVTEMTTYHQGVWQLKE
jgi:hypothetical protein